MTFRLLEQVARESDWIPEPATSSACCIVNDPCTTPPCEVTVSIRASRWTRRATAVSGPRAARTFLGVDDQLRALGAGGRFRERLLQHRDLLARGIDGTRRRPPPLRGALQRAAPLRGAPEREMRRVQALAPQQRPEFTRLRTRVGGRKHLHFIGGAEPPTAQTGAGG